MRTYFSFVIVLFFISCNPNQLDVNLEGEAPAVDIRHYDEQLFEANPYKLQNKLDKLAQQFPVFINGDYKNPAKINGLIEYVENPLNRKLYRKSQKVFEDLNSTEQKIQSGFHHFQHYFPELPIPTIYFYISGLNYEQPIIITKENEILVGKDLFLGGDYEIYGQYRIPQFISHKFEKDYLPYEVFRSYAYQLFGPGLRGNNLLEYMIALGKVEYFINAMYPSSSDKERFAFTKEQIAWCNEREKAFWTFLTEGELLFNKDYHEYKKFIEDRPFVSSLERESPGRAGVWVGYQIVKKYMNNTETTLKELMQMQDQMRIFNESRYNP